MQLAQYNNAKEEHADYDISDRGSRWGGIGGAIDNKMASAGRSGRN